MEERGEWARMRAISHSSNDRSQNGSSSSRMYRFMPPPANLNYGTTVDSNPPPAVPSLFTNDDAIDPFASDELEAESHSNHATAMTTDQQLFEQAGAEPRNHWNPSHTSPSLFPQAAPAESDWRMDELGDIRRTLLGGSAAAAASSSSSSRMAPVSDLQMGGEYQASDEFPLPANKRARTTDPFDPSGAFYSPRDTVSDADAFNFHPASHFHSSNSSVASTGSNNSSSKKKRFHKSHAVAQQRHVVPTLATPIGEGNEDADDEYDHDLANETQISQPSNRNHSHPQYLPDTSSLSTLSAAASSSTSGIFLPRSTSFASSSSSARVAWTTGRHGDSASTRRTSPSRVSRIVSAAGMASFRKPSVYTPPNATVLRQSQSSSLASTGQMWIGDFSKGAVMDQQQIQQRIDFLKQQVSEPNYLVAFSIANPTTTFPHLTLSPTFFSMALSLLMRQNTLTSDQTDTIFQLIDIAVNNQLVPAALLNKFTQHLSESTHHFPQHQLRLAQLETMLESQVAGTMFAAVESSVAHTHARPSNSTADGSDGGKKFLSQMPQAHTCPICGVQMVANSWAYQAHVSSCQMVKQQERLRAARAAAAQEKKHVSEYVAQLIRTTSQYRSTNATPAYSASAGTSKSEAISISDSDDDTGAATKKEIPKVESEESKLERISTTQRLSLEESLRFIKSSFDEFISSQRLPLVDPLTLTRIEIPIRSIKCTHVRCVDLAIFLGYVADAVKRKDPIKCMVCRQLVDIREIKVDSFIQARIQESATSQAEEVILHSDGSYQFVGANGAPIGSSGGASPSTNNSSSMPAVAPTLQKQTSDGSSKRKKEVHTVDLLDDDEEASIPAPKHPSAASKPAHPNPQVVSAATHQPATSNSSSSSSTTTSSSDAENSSSESGSARTSSSSEPSQRAQRRSQLGFKRPRLFPRSTSPDESNQDGEGKQEDDQSGQSNEDDDTSSTDASEPGIAKVYARAFGPRRFSSERFPATSSSSTLRPRHAVHSQQAQPSRPPPAEIDLTLSSDESEVHAQAAPPRRVASAAAVVAAAATASLSNSTSSFPLSNPSSSMPHAAQEEEAEDSRTAAIDAISAAALAATHRNLLNNAAMEARNEADAEDALMKAAAAAAEENGEVADEAIAAALPPDLNMFSESFPAVFSPEQLAAAARDHEANTAMPEQQTGSAPAYSPFPVHPPSLSTLSPAVQNSSLHESLPASEKV